jgi:hypothetical protein
MRRRPFLLRLAYIVLAASVSGCGTGTLDMGGYPNAAQDRLYRDGRLGGDKGIADFDLRKASRAAIETIHASN